MKDIAKYEMTEEDFYNQKVEISYKVSNQKNYKKIANLLSKFLKMDFEKAKKIFEEKHYFKNAVKYFANNVKNTNSQFFTFEKKCTHQSETLSLSFSNSKFQIEVEI